MGAMSRWEPNARDRLAEAALDLFVERGYEATTVADIAERAGLTERTFYRQFQDKREVLFGDPTDFYAMFTDAIAAAPAASTPLQLITAGIRAAGERFAGMHGHSRRRQSVIDVNPPLQEREQIKRMHLTEQLAAVLRRRGVADPAAGLTAELGTVAFYAAFARWVRAGTEQDLAALAATVLTELRMAAA